MHERGMYGPGAVLQPGPRGDVAVPRPLADDAGGTGDGEQAMARRSLGVPIDKDRGPAMQTRWGRAFYPLDPRPEDIDIADIASALSKLCRYTGHTKTFYSVAQHCVLVSTLVPEEHARWGLLHDASEAYTGDMSRPMKLAIRSFNCDRPMAEDPLGYDWIANNIEKVIAEKFGCNHRFSREKVKAADIMAAAIEKSDVMIASTWEWPDLPKPLPQRIVPVGPVEAELMFLQRYVQLFG